MNTEIRLVEQTLITLDYRTIKPLQGNRKILLPDAEKRLLNSLKEKGRFVPEYVWQNPTDGAYYTLDGHSRLKTYEKHGLTFNGGYDMPFLLIQAENEKDAAEKLQIIDSDYGKVTREGQQQFADLFKLDVEWLNKTTMLTEFADFNFIDDFRAMQSHLNRDIIIPNPTLQTVPTALQTPPSVSEGDNNTDERVGEQVAYKAPVYTAPPEAVYKPTVTDDNYSNITEVVKYDYKLQYNNLINTIMQREGFERREEAFYFMVCTCKEALKI
jgi:hypothetical protein